MRRSRAFLLAALAVAAAGRVARAVAPGDDAETSFEQRIRPTLAGTCFACHGGKKTSGVRAGTSYGVSDEYGNSLGENPVQVHDFHATILRLMGLGHTHLTHRYSGRDFGLTDVHGHVIGDVIA
jgi:Protein of unknown function (DUF1501)